MSLDFNNVKELESSLCTVLERLLVFLNIFSGEFKDNTSSDVRVTISALSHAIE